MAFNPRSVAAKLALGLIPPEQMPDVACDALLYGLDGMAICRMAGLVKPTGWEVDQLLPDFCQQAGLNLPSGEDAALRVAYDIAREIIDERKDPFAFIGPLCGLWISQDHLPELSDFGLWDDLIYISTQYGGKSEDEVRADMRDQLIVYIRQYESRHKDEL